MKLHVDIEGATMDSRSEDPSELSRPLMLRWRHRGPFDCTRASLSNSKAAKSRHRLGKSWLWLPTTSGFTETKTRALSFHNMRP